MHFEHRELATLCQIDYRREMVFVALSKRNIVGEMRLWTDVNTNEMEFAIMVESAFQGTGLGRQLMQKTLDYAAAQSIDRIVADVLPENTPMLMLGRRFGFKAHHEQDGTVRLTLPLNATRGRADESPGRPGKTNNRGK